MKVFVAASLLAVLAGCATQGKSDQQIVTQALSAHVVTLPAGDGNVSLPAMKIRSHGVLADNLAIAAGGGANAAQLKDALLKAKADGDSGFLVIGAGTSLDVAIISNACEALTLTGLRVYYAGTEAQKEAARRAIEKTQAHFEYISLQ
jgi:hypothetical protein